MSRKYSPLVVCGIVLLVISAGTVATAQPAVTDAYDGTYGPGAADMAGLSPFGPAAGDEVARYGASQTPGVFVYYANDSYSSLESWAESGEDRRIITNDSEDRRALVTAPAAQLGLTTLSKVMGNGLASKSYVEHIALNLNVEYAEPVSLEGPGAFDRPVPNALVSGGWSTEGVAYKGDAPQATPADAWAVMGATGVSSTGAGVTAGVCDTGVNTDEGTLLGNGTRNSTSRIVAAHNFITDEPGNASNGFTNVSDGNGHGTWVTSALSANASGTEYDGMAPNADLVIGKALNDDGQASTDQIADCVEYMEAQGVDVLSLSVGSPLYSPVLAQELDDFLAGNGTVALVAAGNARMQPVGGRYVNSPADTPRDGVLAIAATNAKQPTNASSAYFSSVAPDGARDLSNGVTAGQEIDLAAPGMNTTARTIDDSGFHRNSTLSGTSMATPYVAGAAALYLDANPNRINDTNATMGYLRNTTSVMPSAGVTEVGQGMVNVSNLIAEQPSEESQTDARNADAERRDAANRGYSGSAIAQALARVL